MSEGKGRPAGAARSISPRTIREFTAPAVIRGYDRDVVDGFLKEVATTYERAVNDLAALERRVRELETAADQSVPPWVDIDDGDGPTGVDALKRELQTYREREHAVAAALVVAQKGANDLRAEAEKDAERIRMAVAADVEELRSAAKEEAESIVVEARLQAKKIEEEASADRSAFERELERLRLLKEATRQDLSEFLTQALRGLQEPGNDDRAFPSGATDEQAAEPPSSPR
jgi:cell division septum initiation protein DivIVA